MILIVVGLIAVAAVLAIAMVINLVQRRHELRRPPRHASGGRATWDDEPEADDAETLFHDWERPGEIASEPRLDIPHKDGGDDGGAAFYTAPPPLAAPPSEEPALVPLPPAPPPPAYGHAHADGGILMPLLAPAMLATCWLRRATQEAQDQRGEKLRRLIAEDAARQQNETSEDAQRRYDEAEFPWLRSGQFPFNDLDPLTDSQIMKAIPAEPGPDWLTELLTETAAPPTAEPQPLPVKTTRRPSRRAA